jgi:signal transduction histidine kinase
LLAFPGSVIAGYALLMQLPEFTAKGMPFIINKNLSKAAYVLFVYSFVAGVVVPPANFFPADFINMQTFQYIFHLPIQVLRSICGLLLAIYIIRVLAFYDLETRKIIEEADRRHAIFEERERIIQGIYGVGLQMQYCMENLQEKPVVASNLRSNIDRLNEIICDIRAYIVNLRTPLTQSTLKNAIEQTAEELRGQTEIEILVQVSEVLPNLKEEAAHNFLLILKEALHNAIRHAHADSITVICEKRGDALYLSVIDDGIGFTELPSADCHNGVKNMKKRAALIGGEIRVTGYPTRGTEVCLSIPCSDGGGTLHGNQSINC